MVAIHRRAGGHSLQYLLLVCSIPKAFVCDLTKCCFIYQGLFDAWLTEKEEAVNNIHTTDFKDQNEMLENLQKLAVGIFIICHFSMFVGCVSDFLASPLLAQSFQETHNVI